MKVTAAKTAKKQSNSSESRFNSAWQRVVKQRDKNQKLQQEMTQFANTTMAQLQPSEQEYANTIYLSCEHLLGFYQRKSLALWQREVLMDWFQEHYQFLCSSPFAGHLDIESLQELCHETLQKMHPEMIEYFENMAMEEELDHDEELDDEECEDDELEDDMEDEPSTEDMFESLFADFINNMEGGSSKDEENLFDEFFHQQQAEAEKQQEEERELDKLMKTGALNKLFRKLLRQLHPDLEQDAERQKEKNKLVSQLTDARDSGDIGTIFTMYAEHLGESPLLTLGNIDLDNATKVLQRQFEQLRYQADDILNQTDPITAALYSRFHRHNEKASQRAITEHIRELEQDTQAIKLFNVQTTSIAKLKPYLEARYEHQLYDTFD